MYCILEQSWRQIHAAVNLPISCAIRSSTLVKASLTAAVTKSSNISTSSGSTAVGANFNRNHFLFTSHDYLYRSAAGADLKGPLLELFLHFSHFRHLLHFFHHAGHLAHVSASEHYTSSFFSCGSTFRNIFINFSQSRISPIRLCRRRLDRRWRQLHQHPGHIVIVPDDHKVLQINFLQSPDNHP